MNRDIVFRLEDFNRLQLFAAVLAGGRFDAEIDGPLVHSRFRGPTLSLAYAIASRILGSDSDKLRALFPNAVGATLDPAINPDWIDSIIRASGFPGFTAYGLSSLSSDTVNQELSSES